MNGEYLWEILGEIDEDIIDSVKAPPVGRRKKITALVLAAVLVLLFSVGAFAAARFNISFADIFGFKNAKVIEEKTENLEITVPDSSEEKAGEEKSTARFTAVSALADERILYILWQMESPDEPFPKGAEIIPTVSFGEASVDTSLGFYGGMLPEKSNDETLVGFIIADWNEAMQNSKGKLSAYSVNVPTKTEGEKYKADILSAIEQSVYIESEYPSHGGWPFEHYAKYQWLDIPVFEDGFIDLAVYEEGKLILVTRHPWRESSGYGTPELLNGKSGKILEPINRMNFTDKNGWHFVSGIYEVDYSDLDSLYFYRNSKTVMTEWLSGEWEADFQIAPALEDRKLDSAVKGTEIFCSEISMNITGKLPEMDFVSVVLDDGSHAPIFSIDDGRIIFSHPINPESIISVIYNETELLRRAE